MGGSPRQAKRQSNRPKLPVPEGFDPNARSTLSAGSGVGPTTAFAVLRASHRIGVKRITRFINGQALSGALHAPNFGGCAAGDSVVRSAPRRGKPDSHAMDRAHGRGCRNQPEAGAIRAWFSRNFRDVGHACRLVPQRITKIARAGDFCFVCFTGPARC